MNSVLIIRFSSLGDVVIATSVIEAVRNRYPDSKIYFLTKSQYFDIINGLLPQNQILVIDKKAQSLQKQVKFLRELKPDVVVDLHRNLRSILVSHIVPGRVYRTRKRDLERRRLIHSKSKNYQNRHIVDDHFSALKSLDLETTAPHVVALDDEIEFAKLHSIDKNTVLIHPGAKWALKKWDFNNFLKLAGLIAQNSLKPVILSENSAVTADISGFPTLSGLSLSELKGVLSQASVFVGNDSGPTHLAAALSTQAIALFGPTHPALGFAPYGKFGHLISKAYPCSPCTLHGEGRCKITKTTQAKCLDDIQPEQVLEKILTIFEKEGTVEKG